MSAYEVREIAEKLLAEMGGNAEEICSGDCPIFAMRLIDRVGYGQVVSNLANAMKDDISGYDTIAPETRFPNPDRQPYASHCWVKIDGRFYDAFNPEGVREEYEMEFYQQVA